MMDTETTIFLIVLIVSVYLWFSSLLIWGIWIHRYIERNGVRPASFEITFLIGWGPLLDYRKARSIAAQHGRTPWFLRCFAWLAGLGLAGFIATLGYLCATAFLAG